MIRYSTLALVAVFAAAGAAAPAAAQGYTPAATAAHHGRTAGPRSRVRLYNMVPGHGPLGGDADAPAATGGGSIGYNKMIYNW